MLFVRYISAGGKDAGIIRALTVRNIMEKEKARFIRLAFAASTRSNFLVDEAKRCSYDIENRESTLGTTLQEAPKSVESQSEERFNRTIDRKCIARNETMV